MAVERLNEMEELQLTVEALQVKEKALRQEKELLQRLHSSEESFRSLSQEKDNLKVLVAHLEVERDTMEDNMSRLYKTIEKTVAANWELQEQVKAIKSSRGCHGSQTGMGGAASDKSTQFSEDQEMLSKADDELEWLNAELRLQVNKKQQLLAENKEKTEKMQQMVMDNIFLQKVMDDLWQTVLSLRMENDHLRCQLIVVTEKNLAKKLPMMEKKVDYVASIALNLKTELDSLKAVVAKACCSLTQPSAAHIRKHRRLYEQIGLELWSLLNDIKHYFAYWYKESNEYYVSVSKYTMDLLEENLKQLRLLVQIKCLKRMDLYGEEFKQLSIPALRKKLDDFLENILEDVSGLEEQLLGIEAKIQELESNGKEVQEFLERCSLSFSVKDFEEGIGCKTERLRQILEVLKQKSEVLVKTKSDITLRHACYYREAEVAVRASRGRSDQWLQELKALQEKAMALQEKEMAVQEKEMAMAAAPAADRGLEEPEKLGTNLAPIQQPMTAQPDKAAEGNIEEMEGLAIRLAKADVA